MNIPRRRRRSAASRIKNLQTELQIGETSHAHTAREEMSPEEDRGGGSRRGKEAKIP